MDRDEWLRTQHQCMTLKQTLVIEDEGTPM
jgi:hypothetical protein